MKLLRILFTIGAIGMLASCKKDSIDMSDVDGISDLGGDSWVKGPIDNWILDNYTNPYNISIDYRWDQFEADIDKMLVPPKEEYVIPVMNAVKRVWVDTYIAEADDIFFKRYAPKFFTLVGSVAYNSNGTVKLGQAEGGRKVLLYNINNTRVKSMYGYKSGDSAQIKQMVHTIHHEFAHILHQTILYPADFKNINGNLYTADWINYSDSEALRDGFVTAYAMNQPDEDFVETLSVMLIEGKQGFEKMIAGIPDGVTIRGTTREKAIERLRAKEAIVVNYFKQVWKIDFYSLQDRTRKALEAEIY